MTEIYIDNKSLDLYSDEEIVMTFAVNDLFTLDSTDGSYSNTFKLPATHNNNLILEQINNILSTSEKSFRVSPAQIYVDGLLQVDGFAQLVSASKLEYEVRIFSGNTNWFESIADKSLQELLTDCSDTFFWTESHVTSNRSNVWTDKFIYPNIDYGDLFFKTGNDAEWYELYPAIYCKYLFKKIFDDAGFTISSDWFDNNELFEKQIIPFSARWKRDKDYSKRNYFNTTFDIDQTTPDTSLLFLSAGVTPAYSTTQYDCYSFLSTEDWATPLSPPDVPKECFWLVLDGGTATINYNITVEIWNLFNPLLHKLLIGYHDSIGNQSNVLIADLSAAPLGTYNYTGTIEIEIGRGPVFIEIGNMRLKAGSTFEFSLEPNEIDEGELEISQAFNWVTLGSTLPDIPVADFIQTIANQYGLVFEQEILNNNINIYQFSKVVNNITQSKDWSDKLDLQQLPVINFLSDEYFRNNYLRYSPDGNDEYLTRLGNYGEGNLIIGTAPEGTEQEIYISPFAPVIRLLSFTNTIELAYIPVFEGIDFNEVVGRMAYVEQDTSALLTISGNPIVSPQPNVYFDELVFQQLINKYYTTYNNIINVGKSINCFLRLNNVDINTLDFGIPIYIDYFGAYFYMNEINQYKVTSSESTEVTLILISN